LGQQTAALQAQGLPIAPYDGAAEFYAEKLEDILAVFGDKDYAAVSVMAVERIYSPLTPG
jgi:hypothetical protein